MRGLKDGGHRVSLIGDGVNDAPALATADVAVVITALVTWDIVGTLPLPLGVAGHEGSTVIVGLNGLRLLRRSVWPRLAPGHAAPRPGQPSPAR